MTRREHSNENKERTVRESGHYGRALVHRDVETASPEVQRPNWSIDIIERREFVDITFQQIQKYERGSTRAARALAVAIPAGEPTRG